MQGSAIKYLSLFHGIGAVDLAWMPLGWTCVAYAEIEPFPIAVTKHHHPEIPNLGDVSQITDEQIAALGPIDLVVGGSPCQDLSVAGKRAGLAGARSGLFHHQMRIYHAARTFCGARFMLWENVPGAFSSHGGRDFGIVVGSMAGAELAVPSGGWGTCGAAIGENGLVEWRVLDAQYVRVESHPRAVPQRRRRVFALLDSGDWFNRPPILLEPEGLCGHLAPRRETGQGTAARAGCGFEVGGALGPRVSGLTTDECAQGAAIVAAIQGAAGRENPNSGPDGVGVRTDGAAYTLEARSEVQMVAHSLKAEGFDASEDRTGRGVPLVPDVCGSITAGFSNKAGAMEIDANLFIPSVCGTLSDGAHNGGGLNGQDAYTGRIIPVGLSVAPREVGATVGQRMRGQDDSCADNLVMAVRTANTNANGHGVAMEVAHTIDQAQGQAIAFESRFARNGRGAPSDVVPPLKAQSGETGKGDGDQRGAVPTFALDEYNQSGSEEVCYPLRTAMGDGIPKVNVTDRGVPVGFDEVADPVAANQARTYTREGANNFRVSNVAIAAMQVRRLTPRECERLQGFPDDYTLIPMGKRNKKAEAKELSDFATRTHQPDIKWSADGPRYKALGNSMAVNVMRWIGERIAWSIR